ncbi:MAG TPA: universal stress protein [Polyangiaceae bacterium]
MKVLAAVDFSDSSLEALRQARELAQGADVAACHVLPAITDLAALFPDQYIESRRNLVAEEAQLKKQIAEYAHSKLGLAFSEVFVDRGSAYAEIVRRAESWHADCVAVGTHGRTGLARVVLGSVAELVVRHAHCSVLVARPAQKSGVVLAATDLSDPSLPTIAAGAEAAKRTGSRLVVVSVLEWNPTSAAAGLIGAMPALPPPDVQKQLHAALKTALEGAVQGAGIAAGGVPVETRVLDGSAASAIVSTADELGAELVVVGTHGRTGLARLALGSVAERVVRAASSSVLAVRLRPQA